MTLVASGAAAALTTRARGLVSEAAAATRAPHAPAKALPPAPPARLLAEIEKQKKSVADQLKAVRGYSLPPGSPMAFVFQPMPRQRRK